MRRCKNCEKLGVTDSSNIHISCTECAYWKYPLQVKPGTNQ